MKTFWDCIRASAGNSFVWETGGPMVMQGTYDPSFTIDLQSKDNQLGYDMAKKYKVIFYLLSNCEFKSNIFLYIISLIISVFFEHDSSLGSARASWSRPANTPQSNVHVRGRRALLFSPKNA